MLRYRHTKEKHKRKTKKEKTQKKKELNENQQMVLDSFFHAYKKHKIENLFCKSPEITNSN
jgi:hypothetical protein